MSPWLFLVCANKFCASWNRVSLVHLYILWEPDVKFSAPRLFFSTNLIALDFVFLPLLLATRAAIWLRRILTKPESEGTILKIWVHLNPHVTPNCRCLMTICLPGGRETARSPWTPELAWPELSGPELNSSILTTHPRQITWVVCFLFLGLPRLKRTEIMGQRRMGFHRSSGMCRSTNKARCFSVSRVKYNSYLLNTHRSWCDLQ